MWIFFFLKNFNMVSYTTSELYPEKFTLSYKKFVNYLNTVSPNLKNFSNLEDSLTSFKPIKLMIESGEWEEVDVQSSITSDELFRFHYDKIVVSSKEDSKEDKNPYSGFKMNRNLNNQMNDYFQSFADKLGIKRYKNKK
jgi:hypothetical protein